MTDTARPLIIHSKLRLLTLFSSVLLCFSLVFNAGVIHADTDPQISDSPVTASIPVIVSTSDTTPPTIPILIRPADETVTSDSTPEFAWYQSTDPNGNFVSYTVYINGVATYLGVSNIGNSAGNGYVSLIDGTQVRVTPNDAFADGFYSWKVVASDAVGNQSSSALWSFTIDTVPPVIVITAIDDIANPDVSEGATFDIEGPQEVTIVIQSETYTAVQIVFLNDAGNQEYVLTGTTDSNGRLSLTQYLPLGLHTVQVSATDPANLTSVLPNFYLNLASKVITIPVPGISPPPTIVVPPVISHFPGSLFEYPATISRVAARSDISLLLVALLALLLACLLLFLKRRHNLVLTDRLGEPLTSAEIWHSHPSFAFTSASPIKLVRAHRGRLYIPHLSRFSVLTFKLPVSTVTLCLFNDRKRYELVL